MVKVKLSCFRLVILVILAIVQSSSQATIAGNLKEQRKPPPVQETKERGSGTVNVDKGFVFPDEVPHTNVEDRVFMPKMGADPPPCANGSTFCEHVEGYPRDHVMALLEKEAHSLKGLFSNDVIDVVATDSLQDRIDPFDENPLCGSVSEVVYPEAGENREGQWLFVVKHEDFKQGVIIEKCANEGPCRFADRFPFGIKAQCKQHYIYRTLLALKKNGNITNDQFKLPSCCTCVTKSERNSNIIRDRMVQTDVPIPLTIPKTPPTMATSTKRKVGN